jgi:hypothetical protein
MCDDDPYRNVWLPVQVLTWEAFVFGLLAATTTCEFDNN